MKERLRRARVFVQDHSQAIAIGTGAVISTVGLIMLARANRVLDAAHEVVAPDDSVIISDTQIDEHGKRYFTVTER